jgi:hypothetical protein
LRIDAAAINVFGLKLLTHLKAVDGLLQCVKSPDSFPNGFADRGLGVSIQQGADGISGDEHRFKREMITMLVEPRHIGLGAPAFLGRCRPFGTNTHGIKAREIL